MTQEELKDFEELIDLKLKIYFFRSETELRKYYERDLQELRDKIAPPNYPVKSKSS